MRIVGLMLLVVCLVSLPALAEPSVIHYFTVATPAEQVGYQAIVDAFNASQDRVRVEIEFSTGGWDGHSDKVLASIAGGIAPDVVRLNEELLPEFAAKGMVVPLDKYVERDGIDLNNYFRPALEGVRIDGSLYGFPLGIKVNAFAYNRDLFRERGLAFPDLDWRWEHELKEATSRLITTGNEDRPTFGMSASWNLSHMADIIWSYGGELFSEDFSEIRLNDPKTMQALEMYWNLLHVDQVAPNPRGGGLGQFLRGELGIWTTGAWEIVRLRNTEDIFDWDFTLKPQGPAGRVQTVRGSSYAIPSASAHQDEAWEFVKFVMSVEGGEVAFEYLVEGVPMHREVAREWNSQPQPPYNPEYFIHAIQTGRPYKVPPGMAEIERALNDGGWDAMRSGEISPRIMADRVVPVVNELLGGK